MTLSLSSWTGSNTPEEVSPWGAKGGARVRGTPGQDPLMQLAALRRCGSRPARTSSRGCTRRWPSSPRA
jgi:hypothetical protein